MARAFSKITHSFWTGTTGLALKGDPEATVVALYLLTNRHSNMIGLYHLPMLYLAHETGMTMEGASKGLRRVIEAGLCEYDDPTERVWVPNMAAIQVGASLSIRDKQTVGVWKQLEEHVKTPFYADFWTEYADAYHLSESGLPKPGEVTRKPLRRSLEGAPKVPRSQEQEQEQEQERERRTREASPEPTRTLPASNTDDDFDPLDLEPGVPIDRAVGIAATMWRNDPSPAAAIALELHTEYAAQCARKGATAVRPGGCIETLIRLVLWAHRNKDQGEDTATVCKRMVLHSLTDEWSGGGKYLTSPPALWGGRDLWAEKLGKLEADSRATPNRHPDRPEFEIREWEKHLHPTSDAFFAEADGLDEEGQPYRKGDLVIRVYALDSIRVPGRKYARSIASLPRRRLEVVNG